MNPYAPPSSEPRRVSIPSDALGDVLEEHRVGNEKAPQLQWTLTFHTHALAAARADGMRLTLTRDELVAHTDLLLGSVIRSLAVREPQRAPIPLTPPAQAALRRFIEPVYRAHLAATLKRRMRFTLPIGVFVVAMSVPPLIPALDLRGAVIGGAMIAVSLLTRVFTHRALFLADSLVWLLIAVNNAMLLAANPGKWSFGVFAVLGLVLGVGLTKLFAFYGPAEGT